MPDAITARAPESKFRPHPVGQFVGQCVDCVDLGDKFVSFAGSTPYLAPTCVLVFRTGERNEVTGDYIDVSKEFSISMGEKANLRKFLEQWRGRAYTDAELDAGVKLEKLAEQFGLLSVSQRRSAKGRTYAEINSCVPVPGMMQHAKTPFFSQYKRDEFWEKRRQEYAEEAARFNQERQTIGPLANAMGSDPYGIDDEPPIDDDLPF